MADKNVSRGTKKPKTKDLTPREAKLHKLIIENDQLDKPNTMETLLLEAGYSESTAKKCSGVVIGKVRKKTGMSDALEEAGITNKFLAEKIGEGLQANKVISAVGGKDAGPAEMDFIEVPDHANRHKYLDSALKIKGAYVQEKADINVTGPVSIEIVRYGGGDGKD